MSRSPMIRYLFVVCTLCVLVGSVDGSLYGSEKALKSRVGGILGAAGLSQRDVSISVLDARGRPAIEMEPSRALKPASNLKILTTLAGIEILGRDYKYRTEVSAKTGMVNGKIPGDITLWSNGDPNISGRFYDGDPLALFRRWARALTKAGLREVSGDLLVDDRYFDRVRFPPTWNRANEGRPFAAEVSSLNFNDNVIEIRILPGARGGFGRVRLVPACSAIQAAGSPRTHSGKTAITIRRSPKTNRFRIAGKIRAGSDEWYDRSSVYDPALYFAHTLRDVWRREGVAIRGDVRRVSTAPTAKPAPGGSKGKKPQAGADDRVLLVQHSSRLSDDLSVINKDSQNLHAEVLLKSIGAKVHKKGSAEAGASAIVALLDRLGVPTESVVIVDGSGLSHSNRVSTEVLSRMLHRATQRPYFELFRESLAVAGVDGTLEKRFRKAKVRHLKGNVFAKSGYINGVSGLSGYVQRGDTVWSFSMLFSRLPGGNASIKLVQERILAAIEDVMPGKRVQMPRDGS